MTIENHIEQLKKLKSFHNGSYGANINFAIDTMSKYQEIIEIVKSWRENGLDYDSCDAMDNIERVIEDGNDE